MTRESFLSITVAIKEHQKKQLRGGCERVAGHPGSVIEEGEDATHSMRGKQTLAKHFQSKNQLNHHRVNVGTSLLVLLLLGKDAEAVAADWQAPCVYNQQ